MTTQIKSALALLMLISGSFFVNAQEGIPVYSDYLTDNLYLLHPSMAGASNASKVRLTARQQWFDVEDAPSLQTLSLNGRITDKIGVGGILFNDSNGNFSQTGAYATFAYHLLLSRNEIDLNQLSFGLSIGAIQGRLDESTFTMFDPIVTGIEQTDTYFNLDFGVSYYFLDFFSHLTVKNALPANRDIFTEDLESNNQRRYLLSVGYTISPYGSDWSYEPSIMFQSTDETQERSIDLNMKVYKAMDFGRLWGGLSYRRSFEGAEFTQDGVEVSNQKLQLITPFVGVDYNNFMFAYTYSYQANSVVLSNSGCHQLTIGFKFNERRDRYDCNCPAINY